MQHIPLCVVNIDGYFDGTIAQITRANEENLLYDAPDEYFHVEPDITAALEWCMSKSEELSHKIEQEASPNSETVGKGGSAWSMAEGSEKAAGATDKPKTVFH